MTISTAAQPGDGTGWSLARRTAALRTMLRYGASTSGPVAVSAAHFLASLIFLRTLPAHEFGLFSFLMVLTAFGMSATAALIVMPITQTLLHGEAATRAICFKMNWLACAGFGALLFAALALNGAAMPQAGLLGLYGAVFAWRWVARNMAYIDARMGRAIASDLLYSVVLIAALGLLAFTRHMSFTLGSDMLLASALVALLPFGTDFLRGQLASLRGGRFGDYRPIFRDLSRWALVGVALTEVTINAHAYLVTFICGPGAFALLALGMLLMRPAALVQTALPDMERPAMARAIAAGDFAGLARIRRHFTAGLTAAWVATVILAAALLIFFPHLILKKGYAQHDVIVVALICAAIMAVRTLRTPPAVLLQAAGQFKALAEIGTTSCLVSVSATLALLLTLGPIASLLGILLGEFLILAKVQAMARDWKRDHG